MHITEITVQNFRNLETSTINLNKGLNIFSGKNAQGKTNLLESIYVCAIGKSPRINKLKDCITWGKNFSKIKINLKKNNRDIIIDFRIFDNGKKAILINGSPIKSLSQLLGELNVVYFFPDDLKLIKEAPTDRRKFIDISLSQVSKVYFNNLMKYNQVLAQRNKLLKNSKSLEEVQKTISIWDTQLSTYASNVILSRIRFLNKLSPLVEDSHLELSENKERLKIEYQGILGETVQEIREKLLSAYQQSLEKDFYLGYTSIGPHKDDIKIMLNGIDVRNFGSQGQQRTASLALKFGEIELLKKEFNEEPVLLLDDVLSELDEKRREKLIEKSTKLQCIITCTEFKELADAATIFQIINGKVEKIC